VPQTAGEPLICGPLPAPDDHGHMLMCADALGGTGGFGGAGEQRITGAGASGPSLAGRQGSQLEPATSDCIGHGCIGAELLPACELSEAAGPAGDVALCAAGAALEAALLSTAPRAVIGMEAVVEHAASRTAANRPIGPAICPGRTRFG
jgi:hypothetical protein